MSTTIGNRAPENPQVNDIWISTALADVRFPSHPGQTRVAVDAGATPTQEPNAWYYNGVIYLIVNQSAALILYTATAPASGRPEDVTFTRVGTVMGGGVGGELSGVVHPSLYIEDETVYVFYINSTGGLVIKGATATMANVASSPTTAFGGQSILIQKAGGVLAGMLQCGNFSMIKTPTEYILLIEALWGTGGDGWTTAFANGSTPLGAFTMKAGATGSLHPSNIHQRSPQRPIPTATNYLLDGFRSWGSSGPVFEEDGQYTMIYHSWAVGSGDATPASDIYRATSKDGIDWKIDNWGYPIHSRQDTRWELDQVADPCPVKMPGGYWCFWTAASNPDNLFVVKFAPLSPTMKMWDGFVWQNIDQSNPQIGAQNLFQRPRYAISGQPLLPFQEIPVDPGATAGFVVVLPTAFSGNIMRIAHNGTGVGTVQVTCRTGDVFVATGTTSDSAVLTKGQMATYKCFSSSGTQGNWVRMG